MNLSKKDIDPLFAHVLERARMGYEHEREIRVYVEGNNFLIEQWKNDAFFKKKLEIKVVSMGYRFKKVQ